MTKLPKALLDRSIDLGQKRNGSEAQQASVSSREWVTNGHKAEGSLMKACTPREIFKQYDYLKPLRIVCVELLGATIALRADTVVQVCRWSQVVQAIHAEPGVSRVVLCGGKLIPVADMRKASERDTPVLASPLLNFLTARAHGCVFGMLVNEVYGAFDICALDIQERSLASTMAQHIVGSIRLGGEQIPLVDLNRLFKPWNSGQTGIGPARHELLAG